MKASVGRIFVAFAASLLVAANVCVGADEHPRTPISLEWITGALISSGVQIEPDQLEALSSVTATVPHPRLRVVSVEVLDGESDRARLQCERTDTCLPFYVIVHWGQPGDVPGATSAGRAKGRAPRPEDVMVRSGRAAVLVFEGEHVHMTLPVLCLQSGGRGQRVRVINKENKKVYLARVTGPGVVTSVLSD